MLSSGSPIRLWKLPRNFGDDCLFKSSNQVCAYVKNILGGNSCSVCCIQMKKYKVSCNEKRSSHSSFFSPRYFRPFESKKFKFNASYCKFEKVPVAFTSLGICKQTRPFRAQFRTAHSVSRVGYGQSMHMPMPRTVCKIKKFTLSMSQQIFFENELFWIWVKIGTLMADLIKLNMRRMGTVQSYFTIASL